MHRSTRGYTFFVFLYVDTDVVDSVSPVHCIIKATFFLWGGNGSFYDESWQGKESMSLEDSVSLRFIIRVPCMKKEPIHALAQTNFVISRILKCFSFR